MSSPAAVEKAAAQKTAWAWIVATFFGAGLGKPGPGTWGSVAAVLLWAAFALGLHSSPQVIFLVLIAAITAWASRRTLFATLDDIE